MAQQRALFISEGFIKDNTSIDSNVTVKKLLPTVWWCQKAYIEKVLGSPLFEDLSTKIIAGTVTGDDLTLVDRYIADSLLNWFMMEVQFPLWANYRNKSAGTNDSQWSDPMVSADVRLLQDQFKKRADYFTQRLDSYLCANSKLYPKYTEHNSSDEVIPQDIPAQSVVFLGGALQPNPDKKFLNSSD